MLATLYVTRLSRIEEQCHQTQVTAVLSSYVSEPTLARHTWPVLFDAIVATLRQ